MRRAWPVFLLLVSCAGVGGVTERSFSRDELAELELRTIEVVVVAKGPPLATGEVLNVEPFEAPRRASRLEVAGADAIMRDALAAELVKALGARGFEVRIAGLEPEIAPLPEVETSTQVLSSTAAEVRAPEAPGGPRLSTSLPPDITLEEVRVASEADAILVVRTLIVDEFHLHEPPKAAATLPGDSGPIRQQPGRSYPVRGRLLVGQAFLFDRKTGVRLWSRQLPDFPEGGEILENHPFLAYGFVQKDKAALPEETKAALAATGFVNAMFREFPRAQEGRPEARASLDAIDVEAELREEQFFDRSSWLLEIEAGYAAESSGSDLVLGDQPLPSLGTGAISPNGIARGGVRVGYLAPGGLVVSLAGQFGFAPGSFSRSYHRDAPPDEGGIDRSADVTIDGATTYGAEAGLGYLILLTENLMLLPAGNLFIDVWNLDAAPPSVVQKRSHVRVGAGLDLDLLLSITQALFARVGIGARGGYDTGGPGFGGVNVSVGFGAFL